MAYSVVKVFPEDLRREKRTAFRNPIDVTTVGDGGVPIYKRNVQCLEVSKNGIRFSLSSPLEKGERIMISASRPGLKAMNAIFQIAWCSEGSNEYFMGAKLVSSSREWMVFV